MAYKIKCPTSEFCELVQKMAVERGIRWRGGEKIREEPDGCWIFFRRRYCDGHFVMSRCSLAAGGPAFEDIPVIYLAHIPKLFGKKEES